MRFMARTAKVRRVSGGKQSFAVRLPPEERRAEVAAKHLRASLSRMPLRGNPGCAPSIRKPLAVTLGLIPGLAACREGSA